MHRGKELEVRTSRRDDEQFLLCTSPDRTLKDQAIQAQRRQRFEKALTQLNEGLKKPRARNRCTAVYERLGRIKERYKIGYFYEITVNEDHGKVREVSWKYKFNAQEKPGEYLLRTSRTDLGDEQVSRIHRTLTMIESAFRWLKSDLGLRPNFHQLDRRIVGHAVVSVLAYFMLAPILNRLEWGGRFVSATGKSHNHAPWDQPYGWKGVVGTMSSQTRVTTSFTSKDGCRIDVRTTVEPSSEQLAICRRLNVEPRPLKRIISRETENVVPKNRPQDP